MGDLVRDLVQTLHSLSNSPTSSGIKSPTNSLIISLSQESWSTLFYINLLARLVRELVGELGRDLIGELVRV